MSLSTERTAGMSPVVVILSASLLLAATLLLTSQLSLSSHRAAASQAQTLTAQYAAESGVNRGMYRLATLQKALQGSNFDFSPVQTVGGVTRKVAVPSAEFATMASAFCAGGTTRTRTLSAQEQKFFAQATTVTTCEPPASSTGASRFQLLARLMNANAYSALLQAGGLSPAAATARANELLASSLETRMTWWNSYLSPATPDTASGDLNYRTDVSVRNLRVETYRNAVNNVEGYRYYFKSVLTASGSRPNTDAARVIVPAAPDDRNGIYWLDLKPTPVGVYSFDSACAPSGFSYTGNLPGLVDPGAVLNSEAHCRPAELQTTLPSTLNDLSAGTLTTYLAQFRGAFYNGETFDGDIFTNEFLTFPQNANVQFNGSVQSAGCLRSPGSGGSAIDLNSCTPVMDGVLRRTGQQAGSLEAIFLKKLSDEIPAGQSITNATLRAAAQRWGGSGLQFAGGDPVFNAPYRKIFDNPVAVSGLKTQSGADVPLDPNLVALRNEARGLNADGTPNSAQTGIYVDDLIREVAPGLLPKSLQDGYGLNARVSLQSTDTFRGGIWEAGEASSKPGYDAATGQYGLRGDYQYVQIDFLPPLDVTNIQDPAYGACLGVPYTINLRIDRDGNMQRFTQGSWSGNSHYSCPRPVTSPEGQEKWVPYPTGTTGKKFNGVIFGDGDLQIRNANSRQGPLGAAADLSGGALGTSYPPAVAAFQDLKVGAAKNMYVVSDLTLQKRPVGGKNLDAVNRLGLYAGADVQIGSSFLPYVAGKLPVPPNQANMNNLTLDASIVTPNGRLRQATNLIEENMSGTLLDMGHLNVLGSVVSRYNGEVGRTVQNALNPNYFRGYSRQMTQDPRGNANLLSSAGWTVTANSTATDPAQYSSLTSVIWRQGRAP